MPDAIYIDYFETDTVNKLQTDIMKFVDDWARNQKTPIPQKEIISKMRSDGVKDCTTVNALNSLLKKRFIRRAYMITNKTFYVQLRRV